jgi:hypothetical protein
MMVEIHQTASKTQPLDRKGCVADCAVDARLGREWCLDVICGLPTCAETVH